MKKDSLFHSEFVQNVFSMITGTGIAQTIQIIVSPLLTRIYSPNDFGIFGLYLSIASLVASVATGRYEMAIMLPKNDDDVKSLINLMLRILSIIIIIVIIIIILFDDKIASLFNEQRLSNYLLLVPLFVFSINASQIINYLLIREKKFSVLAINKVINVIVSFICQLIIGIFFVPSIGLVIGNIVGSLFAISIVLIRKHLVKYYGFFKMPIRKVAKEYMFFPLYDMPSAMLNTFSLQLPVMVFSKYFDASVSGYYLFMNKVLMLPTNLVSRSVADVFKQKATEEYKKMGNCRSIYLKTLKSFALIGIIPLFIFFVFGPILFEFIFGKEWITAGIYARILVPLIYIRFIVSPLSYVFYIVQKQKIDLYGQILLLIVSMIAIFIGVYYNNIMLLLIMYSLLSSCMYFFYFRLSYIYSKGTSAF